MKTLAMLVGLLVVASNAVAKDQIVKRSNVEKKAIAAIQKLGGIVEFAEKKPGKPVICVFLFDTNVTDAGLVHLKGLTELQKLWLSATKVTDAGLVHLTGLTNLQTLYLSSTDVTDAGVKKLQAALPKCKIVR